MKKSFRSIAIALASTLTVSLLWQSASSQVRAATFPVSIFKNFEIARNNIQNNQREENFNHNLNSQTNRRNGNIPKGINVNRLSRISRQRQRHILDGDATGGGHGPGRGIPGKSEFPAQWCDRKVLQYISDIIKNPNSRWIQQPGRPPIRWRVEGTREGVDIRVIVEPQGEGVITAFPTNRPRNP